MAASRDITHKCSSTAEQATHLLPMVLFELLLLPIVLFEGELMALPTTPL